MRNNPKIDTTHSFWAVFYTLRAMRSTGLLQKGDLETKMQFVCERICNTVIQQLELRFARQHKVAENFKCLEFES